MGIFFEGFLCIVVGYIFLFSFFNFLIRMLRVFFNYKIFVVRMSIFREFLVKGGWIRLRTIKMSICIIFVDNLYGLFREKNKRFKNK